MSSKTVLIILGHPDKDSLCAALAERYQRGVESTGARVERLAVSDLSFDPMMHHYSKPMTLEPDLLAAQEAIRRADHLAVVYPIWWGGTPALFKGFLDRVLTPDFALRYTKHAPQGLLTGKTMDILSTSDTPPLFHWLYLHGDKLQMRRNIFGLCGIRIRRFLRFGAVYNSTLAQREKWLAQAEHYGRKAL